MKKTTTLLISGFLFLASGCGTSAPTKFYQLSAINDGTKFIDTRKITVGIDTVDVAGYIERPQIVTLGSGAELDMSEFNRWAEPLSHSVQRIVAENISANLKNGMAKPLGVKAQSYDYIVTIELNKFDGKFNDKAQLDVWWSVIGKNSKDIVREHTELSAPIGSDYDDMIAKQNDLLKQLSTQIAQKISKLK